MSREAWREFICAPERAKRHLSAIGRAVMGSTYESIDLDALKSFLSKLYDTANDIRLLANAVDLLVGGYRAYATGPLHRILDTLSNEILVREQIVGPGLRGNPRWDRTTLARMSGALSPVHYISRTAHRSFEMPENQLLSWFVEDMRRAVMFIEQRVGTRTLHPDLQAIREECERAQRHDWFGGISLPLRPTPEMIAAAGRHRVPEYRRAAALARRRLELENDDRLARWHTVMSLLAVNWLEPVNDDDLFELYVLVLTLELLSEELGFGEPVEYGLVTAKRGHVALFQGENQRVRVFFDQAPAAILRVASRYGRLLSEHSGITGHERRPDILVIAERNNDLRIILMEMKKSTDGRYLSDSIYKVFGYLYDFQNISLSGGELKAMLIVPTGASALPSAPASRPVLVASSDDRAGLARALREALTS